jgi:imidazolonepropionase-like amidohydrolase
MHRPLLRRRRLVARLAALTAAALLCGSVLSARQPARPAANAPAHAVAVKRLLIRHAMVIYGDGKPAFGPTDILIQDGLIARVGPSSPKDPPADAVIDATGKYVMPGIVNAHMHLQDERGGVPQPFQYEMNLYLASGATTIRDVGSDFEKAKSWRAASAAHTIAAPRILIYTPSWRGRTNGAPETPQTARAGVRWAKENGADGIKFFGIDRDLLEAALDESHKVGLRSAAHIAVEETTARDFAELGVTSIEHFYGIPDAALDGLQEFPANHNANNEVHRFGRAGELFLQPNLNTGKLAAVLDLMVGRHVFWCPTMTAYVASRDLVRAQNAPWFRDYLHPAMAEYWTPDLLHHGSYFLGWTSEQEAHWARDIQAWMGALREFSNLGGLVTVGDDAGFIYNLYGFGVVREMELLEEAGFQPLEVIKQATVNGAKLIGMDDRLGRVREGYIADLLVVNGNPLENLHLLNPYGADIVTLDGQPVSNYSSLVPGDTRIKVERGGGIEWTIKDGIPYHVPTLMKEVKDMVAKARDKRK